MFSGATVEIESRDCRDTRDSTVYFHVAMSLS